MMFNVIVQELKFSHSEAEELVVVVTARKRAGALSRRGKASVAQTSVFFKKGRIVQGYYCY